MAAELRSAVLQRSTSPPSGAASDEMVLRGGRSDDQPADGEQPRAKGKPVAQYSDATLVPPLEADSLGTPDGSISFEVKIEENDIRARQFACQLALRNNTKNSIDVLAVNYSLGSGVTKERSDNTSFVDLKKEYDQLRKDIAHLYKTLFITYSEDFRKEFARQFLDSLRSQLSLKNLLMAYVYLMTRGLKLYANQMLQMLQRMDVPIASSADARKILDGLAQKGIQPSVSDLLAAKISRMQAIEKIDRNFLRPEYVTQILPGESFEQVYILKAKRKLSSIASYTAAFDVKLAWEEASTRGAPRRHIERTMSRGVSFKVTPSPITLSTFAVIFSLLGAALNPGSSAQAPASVEFPALLHDGNWRKYFVAAVLAVVLYNSIEMTDLKDKFRSISWRSAMVIGLLCGLLSDKMLAAIKSFVGP